MKRGEEWNEVKRKKWNKWWNQEDKTKGEEWNKRDEVKWKKWNEMNGETKRMK